MCFDRELGYLGPYCPWCPDSPLCPEGVKEGHIGTFYQFHLTCKGKKWKGTKGRENCNQLFYQIVSTFKFIK